MKMLPAALYRYEIQKLIKKEKAEIIVEIGVYCGDLSRLIVPIKTVKKLYLIDPWKSYNVSKNRLLFTEKDGDLLYESVLSWSKITSVKDKIIIWRTTSLTASIKIKNESIDFIHIDGNHKPKFVKTDIKAWLPKLKLGKLLTGDDYHEDSVKIVVDKLLGKHNIKSIGNKIWLYRKT